MAWAVADSRAPSDCDRVAQAVRYARRKREYAELRLAGCPLERFLAHRLPQRNMGARHRVVGCTCQCHAVGERYRSTPRG